LKKQGKVENNPDYEAAIKKGNCGYFLLQRALICFSLQEGKQGSDFFNSLGKH
jgi:hypothetical protein